MDAWEGLTTTQSGLSPKPTYEQLERRVVLAHQSRERAESTLNTWRTQLLNVLEIGEVPADDVLIRIALNEFAHLRAENAKLRGWNAHLNRGLAVITAEDDQRPSDVTLTQVLDAVIATWLDRKESS